MKENNIRIWDEWADENGELGHIYGNQWRSWSSPDGTDIDQIKNLLENIKKNPDSRRHVVSAWNVGDIDRMKLPPCHILFQFYVNNNKFSGVVLGLSGGVDSALVAAVATDAFGSDLVQAIMLPSPFTGDVSLNDAKETAELLNIIFFYLFDQFYNLNDLYA